METYTALSGHTSFETAFTVVSNPDSVLRRTQYYWIESEKKYGDRLVYQYTQPGSSQLYPPSYGDYQKLQWLSLDQHGNVHNYVVPQYRYSAQELVEAVHAAIGLDKLNDIQQWNLRYYCTNKLNIEISQDYTQILPPSRAALEMWRKKVLKHIDKSPIHQLMHFPSKPELQRPATPVR